jgi:HK97 family phage prohead protease
MPTKTCAVKVKATAADDTALIDGQFVALASVFNNVDAVGDVVMPGAFSDDLKAWQASGDPIPVLWGHQMNDPDMNLGYVMHAEETDAGLQVKAQLDLENPKAAQVYKLLKGRRVSKMSFAYDIEDGAPAERDGNGVYELRKLKLHEVSVVQIPANPAANVQQVKEAADRARAAAEAKKTADEKADAVAQYAAALVKSGRTISAKNEETLRAAMNKISEGVNSVKSILDALDASTEDGKASPTKHATAEEPDGVKTDSPTSQGTASFRLPTDLALLRAEFTDA